MGRSRTATDRTACARGSKTTRESAPTSLYDGGNPILELDPSGAVKNVNVFAPDGLVARKEGQAWTYYTFDAQGNVLNKLDAGQNVTAGRLLDAWGQGVETTLPRNIDPWGYNAKWGYYYDRETQLYLCQHRMYDASTGRWLNRDPIGLAGGMNLYGYCGSGPVGAADPSGLAKSGYPGQIGKILSGDDPCGGLAGLIDKTSKELEKRRNGMLNDPFDLFNNPQPPVRRGGFGDYWNHLAEFYAVKRYLDALYLAWDVADCDDDDPTFRKSKSWTDMYGSAPAMPGIASPTNWYHPTYQRCEFIEDSSGGTIPWGGNQPGLPWQRIPSVPVPAPTMPLAPPSPIVIPLSLPRIAA